MSNENYTPGEDDLEDDELDATDRELNEIEDGDDEPALSDDDFEQSDEQEDLDQD